MIKKFLNKFVIAFIGIGIIFAGHALAAFPNPVIQPSGGGVAQLIAGTNITLSPSNGLGTVTINSTGGGTPAAPNTSIQFNNSGAFGGSSNDTIDPSTTYVQLLTSFGGGETAMYGANNNILGTGISGVEANYHDTTDGLYAGIVGGNAAPILGGDQGEISVGGVFGTGAIHANAHFVYDRTSDQASEQFSVQDSTNDKAQISLGAAGGGSNIQFGFGGSNNYQFPITRPTSGQVLTATNGTGDLGWVTPSGGTNCSSASNNQILYKNGSGTCTSDANLTWNSSNQDFVAGASGGVGGTGTALEVNSASGSNDIIANLLSGASFQVTEGGSSNDVLGFFTSVGGNGNNDVQLGDPFNAGNGTRIEAADQARQIYLDASNSTLIQGSGNSHTVAQFEPGVNPDVQIGDFTNSGNKNLFHLNDAGQVISFNASGNFEVQDTNVASDTWLDINTNIGTHSIKLGDIAGAYNSTLLTVDDLNSLIRATAGGSFDVGNISGDDILEANLASFDTKIGNIGHGNNTVLDVNDGSQQIYAAANTFYLQNPANGTQNYFQGNWNSGNPTIEFGSAGGSGHSTNFNLNDSTQSVLINAGHPGSTGSFTVDDATGNAYIEIDQAAEKAYFGDASAGWTNGAGLVVNGGAGTVTIGDIIGNNTQFTVNKSLDMLTFGQAGYESLDVDTDPSIGTFEFGDVGNNVHGTTFLLDDQAQTYTFSKPNITIGTMALVFPSANASGVLTNNGSGTLSWAPVSFSSLSGKPTTLAGYGITDAYPLTGNPSGFLTSSSSLAWANITGTPTTLAGYGITNAQVSATSGDLVAQSGAVASVATVTSPNDGNKHTYSLGAYLNVTAVTLDVIQEQVTYTDENGTSQTETFFPPGLTSANIGSIGNFPMGTMNIRVNPNTSITIKTVLTTGTGSIGYDVGGTIQLLK